MAARRNELVGSAAEEAVTREKADDKRGNHRRESGVRCRAGERSGVAAGALPSYHSRQRTLNDEKRAAHRSRAACTPEASTARTAGPNWG
jgi:hypothetical protein